MRPTLFLLTALALGAPLASATAQSIDIVDPAGNCNIRILPFALSTFYIHAIPGGSIDGFTGVEFRVAGVPDGVPWFLNIVPPPIIDICGWEPCDIFGAGARMAFPSCQSAPMILFRVEALAVGTIPAMTLTVTGHQAPSDPEFACPLFRRCDPAFSWVCVAGGMRVKAMYAEP